MINENQLLPLIFRDWDGKETFDALSPMDIKNYVEEMKAEVLNEKEKEYLRAVLRPVRGKILWAKKHKVSDLYFINIAIESVILSDMLSLPYFKKSDNMYVGMEADKPYTEEELKLWDD